MRIFDKYYRILELPVDSDNRQIKAAYRKLAKRYHPDRSGDPATRGQFIDVNEAYEVLMNRDEMVRQAILRYQKRQEESREHRRRYGTSVGGSGNGGSRGARQRAENFADLKFKEFEKSPIYRTAVVLNSVFDYVVFGLGFLMIASPFIGYYSNRDIPTMTGEEREFHILPIFFGIAFLYGMWYFLIKNKDA